MVRLRPPLILCDRTDDPMTTFAINPAPRGRPCGTRPGPFAGKRRVLSLAWGQPANAGWWRFLPSRAPLGAGRSHNPATPGSNPGPATNFSAQPDREEHGPKQLRAAHKVHRSRFASVIRLAGESGGDSWALPIAGCIRTGRSFRDGHRKSGGLCAESFPLFGCQPKGAPSNASVRKTHPMPISASPRMPDAQGTVGDARGLNRRNSCQ